MEIPQAKPHIKADLEKRHGSITELKVPQLGWIIVRGLNFGEYIDYSSSIKMIEGRPPSYEIDQSVIPDLLARTIIYPTEINTDALLPGHILQIGNTVMSITRFEDSDYMAMLYLTKLKQAHTYQGFMMYRLISTFGIEALKIARGLTVEQIVELLVYSELMHVEAGNPMEIGKFLDDVLQKPEYVPNELRHPYTNANKKRAIAGRINLEAILGVKKRKASPPYMQDKIVNDDAYEEILNEKINMNDIPDKDAMTMSASEYRKFKTEGRIMDFHEQTDQGVYKAKNALAAKIAEDRMAYGENRPEYYKGDLNKLTHLKMQNFSANTEQGKHLPPGADLPKHIMKAIKRAEREVR